MNPQSLKVLTYNIHKGFSMGNRKFVLHQIKQLLQQTDADVLFLQEIQGEHRVRSRRHENWPEVSQFEFLADQVWPHHAYGKNAIYDAGHHGNAILSKHPFVHWENINVAFMQTASRSLLHGVVKLATGKRLHVVCVHLGLFEIERQRQLRELTGRIQAHVPDDEPLIIAGDFNDWNGRASRILADQLGLVEAFRSVSGKSARTFPAWMPILSVDRIYSRGLELENRQRLHERPWRGLSDHLPLMAEYTLK